MIKDFRLLVDEDPPCEGVVCYARHYVSDESKGQNLFA